jgi:Icc-related predicted phosphoesterase
MSAAPDSSRAVHILAVSDEVDPLVYSDHVRDRFRHVDLVLSCGDLPYSYLDYIVSMLDVPLYGVRGNHDCGQGFAGAAGESFAWNGANLHGRVVRSQGLLLAGLEGSRCYNYGPCQYSEAGMLLQVARLAPRLLANKARYGRYLDVLVTHAPPRFIHDQEDPCHRGFATFRWFMRAFRPRYLLHGHVHLYDQRQIATTQFHDTVVLNAYSHRQLRVQPAAALAAALPGTRVGH